MSNTEQKSKAEQEMMIQYSTRVEQCPRAVIPELCMYGANYTQSDELYPNCQMPNPGLVAGEIVT